MRYEAATANISKESRNGLIVPSNLNPNFNSPEWARVKRDVIVPVSPRPGFSSVKLLEIQTIKPNTPAAELINKAIAEIPPKIEEVKKELSYNPSKKSREYIDEMGRLIIRKRRKSRCNGIHDAEEDPCGSPRCKTKGRQKLKDSQNKDVTKRRKRRRVILNGERIK